MDIPFSQVFQSTKDAKEEIANFQKGGDGSPYCDLSHNYLWLF